MSIAKNYLGVGRNVPETDETDWGAEVTTELVDLLDGCDEAFCRTAALDFLLRSQPSSSTLAASATLTQTSPTHLVQGTPGAVTLNTTTAIADGEFDGQLLTLIGNHATNTVTIEHDANTNLNGHITLDQYEVLELRWDNTNSYWVEKSRSN
jgi:hypothetical protein